MLLPDYADEIIDTGIDSLTVTVNAVDPFIQAQICDDLLYRGSRYEGAEAAEILIANQLEGIRKVVGAGITVKVNTVLIPEINAEHIAETARTVSDAGAKIYNIIPLIPQRQLAWCSAPIAGNLTRPGAKPNPISMCSAIVSAAGRTLSAYRAGQIFRRRFMEAPFCRAIRFPMDKACGR